MCSHTYIQKYMYINTHIYKEVYTSWSRPSAKKSTHASPPSYTYKTICQITSWKMIPHSLMTIDKNVTLQHTI